MSVPTSPRILGLLCCLLIASPLFASSGVTFPSQGIGKTILIANTRLAIISAWAGPTKQEGAIGDDSAAPKEKTPPPPDSYVGAVVGSMFFAGVVLMMAKLQRRKSRRSIYRYGRSAMKSTEMRRAA